MFLGNQGNQCQRLSEVRFFYLVGEGKGWSGLPLPLTLLSWSSHHSGWGREERGWCRGFELFSPGGGTEAKTHTGVQVVDLSARSPCLLAAWPRSPISLLRHLPPQSVPRDPQPPQGIILRSP